MATLKLKTNFPTEYTPRSMVSRRRVKHETGSKQDRPYGSKCMKAANIPETSRRGPPGLFRFFVSSASGRLSERGRSRVMIAKAAAIAARCRCGHHFQEGILKAVGG